MGTPLHQYLLGQQALVLVQCVAAGVPFVRGVFTLYMHAGVACSWVGWLLVPFGQRGVMAFHSKQLEAYGACLAAFC